MSIKFSTGIKDLDRQLAGVRAGDNVVWLVPSLEEYAAFAGPFVSYALRHGYNTYYIKIDGSLSDAVAKDKVQTFDATRYTSALELMRGVHAFIDEKGRYAHYVFDPLPAIKALWGEEAVVEFYRLICPHLLILDTIAYYGITKGMLDDRTVARVRDTAQVVIDVERSEGGRYIQPIKVLDRFSETMFKPHLFREGTLEALDELDYKGYTAKLVEKVGEVNRAREELHAANEGLEAEVAHRTRELVKANTELNRYKKHLEVLVEERTDDLLREIDERKSTEAALKDSEELYHSLATVSPVGIFHTDASGACVFVNQRWSEIAGISLDEARGHGWVKSIHPEDRERVFMAWTRCAGNLSPFMEEYRFLRPDGSVTWVIGQAISLDEGRRGPKGYVGTVTDITARKRGEEALKRSEASLAAAQRVAQIGNWDWDIVNNRLAWSDEIYRIFGFSPREFEATYEAFLAAVHPDDVEFVKRSVDEALKGNESYSIDHRVVLKGGIEKVVHEQADVICDAQGRPVRMFGTVQDITERKRAEEAVARSEQKFSSLFHHSNDAIFIHDLDGNILDVNQRAIEVLGYAKDELLSMRVMGLHPPEALGASKSAFEAVKTDGFVRFEIDFLRKGGDVFPAEVSASITDIGGERVIQGMVHDITERRRTEDALLKNKLLLDSISDIAYLCDDKGNVMYVNGAAERLTGFKPDELIGMPFAPLFDSENLEKAMDGYSRTLAGEQIRFELVFKHTGVLCEYNSLPFRDPTGKIVGVLGTARDITEKRKGEEALHKSEASLAEAQRLAQIGNWEWDVDKGSLWWSDQMYRIHGVTPAEFSGSSEEFMKYTHPDEVERVRGLLAEAMECKDSCEVEQRIVRPDGSVRDVYCTAVFDRNGSGRAVRAVGTVQDVTERKRTEEELRKVQRLESLGLLAGGIAHDFNNLLTAVIGNISVASLPGGDSSRGEEALKAAEKAALRARELTRQLLTFSKGGAPVKSLASVAGLVKEAVAFSLSGSKARPELSVPDDLWPAVIDEGQITQAVNNIIINADHAMPEGGVIKVRAENVTLGPGCATPLEKGEYVRITITDQGVGIPEEYIAKIFDPYFTTKSKGSGLGLASSYSIVKNHGGIIEVESRLGKGTAFSIYLPAEPGKEVAKEEPARVVMGRGRVLVMDDEEAVRDVTRGLLEALGYSCELVEEGRAAVKAYASAMEEGRPFDAVIMDLTISGGMGGREAVKEVLGLDGKAQVIVSSGFSNDSLMSEFTSYGFKGVIRKPYTIKEFSRVLGEVLNDTGKGKVLRIRAARENGG